MGANITRGAFLGSLLVAALPGQEDLRPLYEAGQWLELGRRVTPASPWLYRGAVAAAMNQVNQAQPWLRRITQDEGVDGMEARLQLVRLYTRLGRFRGALDLVRDGLRQNSKQAELKTAELLLTSLVGFPEIRTRVVKHSRLKAVGAGIEGEIRIDGHAARFVWDTGAPFCEMTEAEARRLGLEIRDGDGTFRLAVAKRIEVGECVVDHVPFQLVPEGGRIGLPLLLALGGFRWKPQGEIEVGFGRPGGEPNLCFNGSMPVVEVKCGGSEGLAMHVDSGLAATGLWPAFAKRFPEVANEGSVRLKLGGREVAVAAHLVAGPESYYGELGLDALQQAKQVTVDFRSMRFELG
jgi:hypothetical protein